MTKNTQPEGDLPEEFRTLGRNIKNALNTAWNSDERKSVQKNIQDGLSDLGDAINNLINDFQTSEVSKKVVKEVDQLGERFRSGEVKEKTKEGVLSALKKMNAELEKAADKLSSKDEKES
jgi:hypothetical protein